ncbi:IS200/IS605 family transposase [Candidatus Pacearchaeota archaeon CG10_big_fil_rev_8_21_14_0_10_31_24]|nr:MAG: IS200/IS605 family transposase [Candidatus Pacearchaeota archaeon CG10_big_fil_rev_8_21_14_0_10_31_24]
MTELVRSSHKVFKIKHHIVCCIKYRKDLFLEDAYVTTLKEVCRDIEKRFNVTFETTGFDEDHVHFLIESLTTTYSPAKIFQIVKSITARELFKRHPRIAEELYHGEFWSDGGYVGTVGEGVNADVIRKYIQSQGRKGEQLKLINF